MMSKNGAWITWLLSHSRATHCQTLPLALTPASANLHLRHALPAAAAAAAGPPRPHRHHHLCHCLLLPLLPQDPLALIGITAIFFPFIILLVAIAAGVVDLSVYR